VGWEECVVGVWGEVRRGCGGGWGGGGCGGGGLWGGHVCRRGEEVGKGGFHKHMCMRETSGNEDDLGMRHLRMLGMRHPRMRMI